MNPLIDEHFCKSCIKIGDRNSMFGKKSNLHHNYGIKRTDILGDNNPSKRIEVRDKISKKNKITKDEFLRRLQDKYLLNDYDFSLVEYIDTKTPIKVICKDHGIFEVKPFNLMSGSVCNMCKKISKGESKIEKILNSKNIKYIKQYTFNDCRGTKRPLPFDFYLPDYNICIEYDGRQHYEPVEKFGGIDGFNQLLKNDNIKTDYCNLNNIKLLRISYKEKNIIINLPK